MKLRTYLKHCYIIPNQHEHSGRRKRLYRINVHHSLNIFITYYVDVVPVVGHLSRSPLHDDKSKNGQYSSVK
jgi:hypothetical protein